ncbi:cache domain-containing protein [Desulforhopalus vacuolatus]|uniref:HD domain-containing phosphohydrolase n=1 Tax=Desulforhopalus vacuolatus TaxID=40414 RepID=UPI001962E698|nr:HD domain-containing phosphohydrolase [Desulforhopalus vacuolatus]MBM9519535.1 cache domain-containing protein [Desulforhopalus vacuolatus]
MLEKKVKGLTRLISKTSCRIALPTLCTLLLFVIAIFFVLLPQLEEGFIARKQEMIRELAETTWSLIENYHDRELSGELSRAEAQKRAILRLRTLRWGPEQKDYFWISDMEPRLVMQPYRRDLEGKDVSGFQDVKLKYLLNKSLKMVQQQGAGYVDYRWQWKDDPTRIVSKRAYVKGFEPWGWFIATGMYLDDVRAEIAEIRKKLTTISLGILLIVMLLDVYSIRQALAAERERLKIFLEREKLMKSLEESLEKLKKSRDDLHASLEETVTSLASTAEKRDPYTAGHQVRVDILASAIGRELGLEEQQLEGLHIAALLHDIGKITLPSDYLCKPSKLTREETAVIRCHPQAGYEILKGIHFPWPVAEIVYQHHEHLDGSGYPRGLTERDILLEAKIITVADVVEAMSSHRPYRASLGIESALDAIRAGRGTIYHAPSVDACLYLVNEKKIDIRSKDLSVSPEDQEYEASESWCRMA